MKIAIIGSGGREHSLGWKIAQSKIIDEIFFIPGNGGTSSIGQNIEIDIHDFNSIKNFILEKNIKLIIVGPEIPLVEGIVDYLRKNIKEEIYIIGPSSEGAKLEGSKEYAKQFMNRYRIPTAQYKTFYSSNIEEAQNFMEKIGSPYVLKADGLAAGKGVLIIDDIKEAKIKLREILDGKFGKAGEKVVIEQYLDGIELSVFVLTDGKNYKILPTSKDYKRIGESDTGLNTGGMGAVSPVPFANKSLMKKIEEKIIIPTINGLKKEHIEYNGFLYFGLMNVLGEPFVIEYNVRMGDPETQAVIPRIKSDLAKALIKLSTGNLKKVKIKVTNKTAVSVVLASGGYPENYEKNIQIYGLDKITKNSVFHAGTKKYNNILLTNGGRVLAITSIGKNIYQAREKTYSTIKSIKFEKKYFRKDIGLDLV